VDNANVDPSTLAPPTNQNSMDKLKPKIFKTIKTDAETVKDIISLEKEGKLDEIASKNREEIAKKLSYEFSVGEHDNDITVCQNSMNKLKQKIFKTICTKNLKDNKEKEMLFEDIEDYKKYFDAMNNYITKNDNLQWEKVE
jgi:hypothetical protein